MHVSSTLSRRLMAALLSIFTVAVVLFAVPTVSHAANPLCGDVILVLDESGSVGPHEGTVRQAVDALLDGVAGEGVSAAVVEFGTAAKTVFGYLPVTDMTITDTFGPYVAATSFGDVFDSPSQLGPYTNWDDALDEVEAINATTRVASLVLFLTDGIPTAYNRDQVGEDGGVTTSTTDPEALVRAIEEADAVTAQGSHILTIGVGAALASSANVDRLIAVSGPDVFDGSGVIDVTATDVVLVPDFADLPGVMRTIAEAVCADPAISITKDVDQALVAPGTMVTYTIAVTNTGNTDLRAVTVTDSAVPTCSALVGDLAEGASVIYTRTATIFAPLTNVAAVVGRDRFGRRVRDTDDAVVDVFFAGGVGTPGYWRNHLDAWPANDGRILVGDWNSMANVVRVRPVSP